MRSCLRNFKAQSLIELMVFGSIMIFLLASIISNAVWSVVENRQKVNILKKVLKTSYFGGYSGMQAGVVHIEDRIAPGISRYGEVDRSAQLFSGAGVLSYWMFYTPDEDEKVKIKYTPYIINGKQYNIPALTEETKTTDISLSNGFIGEDIETIIGSDGFVSSSEKEIKDRLEREGGKFCRKIFRGTSFFCDTCLERFDLKRIGTIPSTEEATKLSWQWLCLTPKEVYEQFKEYGENALSYDINGDLKIEKISMIQDNEDGTYRLIYKVFAGISVNPNCITEGFRNQARILTYSDGISLTINEEASISGNSRHIQSRLNKKQRDIVERQYQINREISISGKMNIAKNLERCRTYSAKQKCDANISDDDGCCFEGSRVMKDCIDTSTNILYIRSIIEHEKKSFWQQKKTL